jgi:hypothetical protein
MVLLLLLLRLIDLALTTFLGFAFLCLQDFILPLTDIIYREVSDSTTVQALACAACLVSGSIRRYVTILRRMLF